LPSGQQQRLISAMLLQIGEEPSAQIKGGQFALVQLTSRLDAPGKMVYLGLFKQLNLSSRFDALAKLA
jgi:hypothetical protein